MIVEIYLTNTLVPAIVNQQDYEYLSQWRWRNLNGYAARNTCTRKDGVRKQTNIYLHKEVITQRGIVIPEGYVVDHINGDKFDNTFVNLRLATKAENERNKPKRSDGRSTLYKGVYAAHGRWLAQIRVNGKRKHLGMFDSPEEAALAYNQAALALHWDFASLNSVEA